MVLISFFIDTIKSDACGYLAKNIIFLSLSVWSNYSKLLHKSIALPRKGPQGLNSGYAIYRLIRTFNFIFNTKELIP